MTRILYRMQAELQEVGMETLTDERLATLVREGNGDAFTVLTMRHRDYLVGVLYKNGCSESDVEDFLQTTLLKAWKDQHKIAELRDVRGWLAKIAVNTLRSDFRHNCRVSMDTMEHRDERAIPQLTQMEVNEQRGFLMAALERVHPMDQHVLEQFYFLDMSLNEMAAESGSPLGTVRRRLFTARNRLREEMQSVMNTRTIRASLTSIRA